MLINPDFAAMIEKLPPSLERLMAMVPVTIATLPPVEAMPKSGIYWLSEGSASIYVGRSRRIRERLQEHVRPSSGHNQASFAFLLAREMTGRLDATYKAVGSRASLLTEVPFGAAFSQAKERIRRMDLRFVEETHPVCQCLLEVYVATVVKARYNDFDSH
ncbi:MAG: GIY-YIG nuclease family protein [Planctomycetes bacterium]|nr:GIY-YIG nuclease family protein [Planctomycetota bacterium]